LILTANITRTKVEFKFFTRWKCLYEPDCGKSGYMSLCQVSSQLLGVQETPALISRSRLYQLIFSILLQSYCTMDAVVSFH